MQRTVGFDPVLSDFLELATHAACVIYGTWPARIWRKRRGLSESRARHAVIACLRRHVCMTGSEWRIAEQVDGGRISYPQIAYLLDLDHSALIHGRDILRDDEVDAVDAIVWAKWAKSGQR